MSTHQDSTQASQIQNKAETSRVAVYALLMALGTLTSRVLGLVRDQLFAAMFPALVRDAWTAAFRLPNLFRRLLGEGSLSVAFIPVFVQARVDDPGGEVAKNLVNSLYSLLLLILATLTAVGTLFPELFLKVMLDPVYIQSTAKFALTVSLAKIMFSFIFFMSSYAFFMGILNALGRYGLPAMAPTFFNVAMIASNFYAKWSDSKSGEALAWGVVLGGFLQMVILIPSLRKVGYFPRWHWDWQNPQMRRILRNMVPGMLGLGLLQITTIVNLRFASSLGEGPITYIFLADRLLELPLSLVSVSLGTALLPTLANFWARGEKHEMTKTANFYTRLNLYLAIPAAIGLFVLAQPIVELLFLRGQFVAKDAAATALVVRVYAFILVSSSCVRVLVPSFYAIKNTWLPATVSGICLVVHLLLAPRLMENWGLGGLVSSAVVTGTLNLTLLLLAYYSLIGPFGLGKVFVSVLRFLVAGLALWALIQIHDPVLQALGGQGFWARLVAVALAVSLGGAAYFAVSFALQLEEFQTTIQTVIMKISRKLKRR